MNDDSRNHRDNKDLHAMYHQECIIMAEYRMLQTENLQGIYVIPSYENSFLWFGVIFVRSDYYEGGVFRFTLTLPENFPDEEVPVLKFTSHLYHPAVDPNTGVLNLTEVFPQWDKKQHHIWLILKYLYSIFHNLNVKVPSNVDASVAYKSNRKLFMEKPYDPDVHDNAKNMMLKTPTNECANQGISWVQQGSFQPFSKEETT
ncbi:unnamed protein product [Arctia plantaginis]|uniref:UBC core domain-containing protein n=1 Tax=Arctia plantaginis TaxID=874455 RepID=A0A8S1ATD2_ARCPL|nr:unnamed protein product [Arctia plantaginis]